MKRHLFLLLAIILLSGAAFASGYLVVGQHRGYPPEVAWLQKEFQLSDDQYARVAAINASYQPRCATMCEAIVAADRDLARQIRENRGITGSVREALRHADDVRQSCRSSMVAHVYEVAGAMPPEQARRYIDMMTPHLVEPGRASEGMPLESK